MNKTSILVPAIALTLLFLLSFSAGGLESILPLSGEEADLALRYLPPGGTHILGTDELGRDVFLRLLHGGQVSLMAGLIAALLSAGIGSMVGMTAGYLGGVWDALLMRLTDFLIALPTLPLLIVLSALDMEKLGFESTFAHAPETSLYKIIALISLLGWTTVARLARSRTVSIRNMDFVRAARALGVSRPRIVLRHIFPNLTGTIATATALSVGNIILTESVLSFLGLGIRPPMASWGNMLTNAEDNIWEHASLTIYPGLMILATVLAFNALGDGLRRSLAPNPDSPRA
jgi:peptide/nickel transport system permease protein